jgi:hypothetical protein
VIRAEASAEDPAAALDLAFGKLLERLRRHRDRRKVHHGRQTPASVRITETTVVTIDGKDPEDSDPPDRAGHEGSALNGATAPEETEFDGTSPIVIRTKDHEARPMSLEQALYEMELVGHDFYLFVDAATGRPSVVYRRRGWSYGVIRLKAESPAQSQPLVAESTTL